MRKSRPEMTGDEGWDSEVSSSLALAGFLALVLVAVTLLAMGPLTKFDAYFNLEPPPRSWLPWLYLLDRIGQRAVCLPILGVVVFLVSRRRRSWRPAVVAAGSVFALHLLVLILKLVLGRGNPVEVEPSFFTAGMAYPSGHSANIVLVYGLVGYLLLTYGTPGHKARVFLWSMVPFLSVLMVVTSVMLNWHWLTDLVSGLLVGGIVLALTNAADHAVPVSFRPRLPVRTFQRRESPAESPAEDSAEPPSDPPSDPPSGPSSGPPAQPANERPPLVDTQASRRASQSARNRPSP